ncbi:hypothetical protein QBC34DRAFT_421841 [Podospora aff. communis PSN243]|uniref:Ribosomal protein bL31m N-terminal domain-containing protein n=1 Tax=Podospora aff. communis PSN243 TaxID=3040156 RepID=A0AAV9GXI1_9PEZI|nr:hypothetical protein QBC34DRAFT_421841 [Podospora aff. communis PSN243]
MGSKLPTALLRRPSLLPSASYQPTPAPSQTLTQVRHATFIPRPRRPYQFTQLVQLSDGSTFTVRTTSPAALYKSSKDTRNHILWQPSDKTLRNVESDEAGKLAAFRGRFGRGWDTEGAAPEGDATAEVKAEGEKKGEVAKAEEAVAAQEDPFDSLTDLISQYADKDAQKHMVASKKPEKKK